MTQEKLEEAKRLYQTANADQRHLLESLFPELAESEDEKIRKELIQLISCMHDADNRKERWIAWLKKQGQEKHLSEPIKDYQGSFTCWNNAHDFRPKHLQRCICYDKYMEGVYCCVYDDISKYWCTQTTEEHDSDGDNHICDYADYRITLWMPLPDTSFYPSKSLFEKQGKKKPINNTGPKFHEGEWVVNSATLNLCHILRVEHGQYICDDCSFPITKENEYHLWTIADAKDGDVLLSKHNQPFIYNGIFDEESIGAYCGIDKLGNHFLIDAFSCDWSYKEGVKPATKEQRDTLFAKMKEAGYVWDAEKKELKKIEQSELTEFEDAVKDMMNAYRDAIGDNDVTTEEVKKHATYLLSLIPHKPIEWSEDDEKNLNDLDVILFEYKHMPKENYWHMINWLKSLKERIGG